MASTEWITHWFFFLSLSTGNQFPPIAAQDLPFVIKAGYLEKRRKGELKGYEKAKAGWLVGFPS